MLVAYDSLLRDPDDSALENLIVQLLSYIGVFRGAKARTRVLSICLLDRVQIEQPS